MAKNILQDIVPPEKRSIRNIPLPQRRKTDVSNTVGQDFAKKMPPHIDQVITPLDIVPPAKKSVEPSITQQETITSKVYSYKKEDFSGSSRFGSKKLLYGSVLGVVIMLALVLVSLFNGSVVTVKPVEATGVITPATILVAEKSSQGEGLPFTIVTLTKTMSKDVSATGEEKVERKASGQIIIYNNFDSNDQRLIKNTRFETPEGLIYRINESVVVPGRKSVGGNVVPGQIEVTVYADEVGDKYNIGKKDFSIPGFKGDPRFNAMYARSKTDMTGGFVGLERKVSDRDRATTRGELQRILTEDLQKEALAQVPGDFVMFDKAFAISFQELPQGDSSGSTVALNEEAKFTGILFQKDELARYVSKMLALPISNLNPQITNEKELSFELLNRDSFNELTGTINFTLDGSPKFVSTFNTDGLSDKLAGQPKGSVDEILKGIPQIDSADVTIRPFWKRSFPEDSKDIKIVLEK